MTRPAAINTPDSADVEIGLAISRARRMRGRSQLALGRAIGCSQQQVQKYESGLNRVSVAQLLRIAAALDVHAATLLPPSAKDPPMIGVAHDGPLLALLKDFTAIKPAGEREALMSLISTMARGDGHFAAPPARAARLMTA